MNISKFKKLNTVAESLGYADSKNYFEYSNIYNHDMLDSHWQKVLNIVNPDSVYIVDNEPFILFFSDSRKIDFKAIWNAQIPFVFVLKEDTVYVYNGKKLIKSNKNLEELERKVVKDIDKLTFSYWNLNNERFLNEYKKELTGNQLNDSLLKNIQTLTNKLKNDHKIPFATKLVLRIIFIRYLIDRGVNIGFRNLDSNIEKSKNEFLEILKNKNELYSLFKYLDKRFDGNLFELNDEENSLLLKPEVFEMLSDFVSGGINLDGGQISLFPMYDFNIITVELISNIYEILLGDEGQQKNQSFYTPSYLVDYMISKTVVEKLKLDSDCRILDPSCGSGIFLVKTYRKIIEKQIEKNQGLLIDDILINELEANIFGIDLSREAIDVSVFSLYLTILDYKNPKDLVNFRLPKLVGKNLFVFNFFDERVKKKIQNINFNFILGNPPWGKITGETDEISKEFVFELSNYLSSETICSLVLPSKLLYNHGNSYKKLREYLLTENHLIEVLELSPVRKEIFKNANAPAVILTYTKSDMNQDCALENKFTHISLKPNIYFELFDILAIEKNDVKFIEQKLLYKNDWAWKVLLYGTSWDLEICSRIKREYPTIGDTIKSINENRKNEDEIIEGTGIQKGIGTDATSFLGKTILDSRTGVDQFVVNLENSNPFSFKEVHRLRNPQVFEAPYCLIKKGINTKTFELKSAYSEEDFVFQETIRAIKGIEEDKNFLKAITGIFNSSLSSYMNVILGTSVGIEREQVFFNEVKNYPFFNNSEYIFEVSKLVDEIQNMKIKNKIGTYEYEIKELKHHLNNLVLKGFDLEGNSFVDYVIDIQIPMIRKDKCQLGNKTVTRTELERYANEFLTYFVKTYSQYGYGIDINISTNLANQFVAFELIIVENSEKKIISFVDNKMSDKEMISRFSIKRQTDSFFSIRDSIVFEDTSFYILKKDLFKNWHPAIAKRDLAEVIERIMNDGEGVD